MDRISIDTTQNVAIQYQVATTPERIGAALLDIFILAAYTLLVSAIMGFYTEFSQGKLFLKSNDDINAVFFLFFLPVMLYSLLCETFFNGQSIGKMAARIKVMRIDGRPATFGNYLLRWLFRLIDVDIFYGIVAILTIAFNGKGQRLGDIVAGTFVIKLKAPEETGGKYTVGVENLQPLQENTYIPVFQEVSKMTSNEAAIIKQVLQLDEDDNRYEMQQKLVTKLKEHLGIVSDMEDGKFLRVLLNDFNKKP